MSLRYRLIGNIIKKEGKGNAWSVNQCNIWYCSLKTSVEKKMCITRIKYFLQHWKKPRRQLVQKITNTSLEFRSWLRHRFWACTITTPHWSMSASVFSTNKTESLRIQHCNNLTGRPNPSCLCDCNAFLKVITFLLPNFDVKTSLKALKVSAMSSTWGTAVDFQTDAVFLLALQINTTV